MAVVRCTLFTSHTCYLLANQNVKSFSTIASSSNRKNRSKEPKLQLQELKFPLKLVIAQSAISLFALGFIDAGYSGDWSRIGVLSKDNEDFLKVSAFFLVPLCIFFLFSLTKKFDD